MLYWLSWAASKLYGIFSIQKRGFTLFLRLRFWPVHYMPEKFKNATLFLHTNPSQKRSFSEKLRFLWAKTLLKQEEFENASFLF